MSLTRRVFQSSGLLASASGASRLFALLAAPVLTALFGPEPYGVMALVYSGAALATAFGLFGIDTAYARHFFKGEAEYPQDIESYCWRRGVLLSLAIVVLIAATAALLGALGQAAYMTAGIAIAVLALLGSVRVLAETQRRVRGQFRAIATAILVAGALVPAMSIVLGRVWAASPESLMIAAALGVTAQLAILGIPWRTVAREPVSLGAADRSDLIVLGAPTMVTAVMFWVLGLADRWILAAFVPMEAVGVYAFAGSLAAMGTMINSAITLTWFPEAVRTHEAGQRAGSGTTADVLGQTWAWLVLGLALVWIVVAVIGPDVLKWLADPRFHGGSGLLPWLAGGIFFGGVASLATTGLMLTNNLRPAAVVWVIGGALAVALNFLVVPSAGLMGAAVVGTSVYGAIACAVMATAQRRYALRVPWSKLGAACTLILLAGIALHRMPQTTSLLQVGFKAGVIVLAAGAAACLLSMRTVSTVISRFLRPMRA